MTMNKELIDKLKLELQAEQKRLTGLLERTGKHLYRRDEPYSADFAEQAVEVENNQVVEALDAEGKTTLNEIKLALTRIDSGTYGDCTKCGSEIAAERLSAIPHVRLCIDCAKKQ